MRKIKLAVVISHPVQYQAPVFRSLAKNPKIDLKVFFASSQGASSKLDPEFNIKFRWDCEVLKGYKSEIISIKSFKDLSNPWVASLVARRVSQKIKQFKPEFILIMGYSPLFYYLVAKRLKKNRARLLFRAETTDIAVTRSRLKTILRRKVLTRFYKNFDHFFAIGTNSKNHFLHHNVSPSKISTSFYSTDTEFIKKQIKKYKPNRDKIREKLGIKPEHFVLIFAGKIIDKKNPLLVIKALQRLDLKTRAKIFLLVVGEGKLRQKFESQAREVLGQSTYFAGFQNQTKIGKYFAASDALVLPSKHGETWGLAVNEALQYGLPCIVSSRVGCANDLIMPGKNGFIFSTNDAVDLAEKITKTVRIRRFVPIKIPSASECAKQISSYVIENSNSPKDDGTGIIISGDLSENYHIAHMLFTESKKIFSNTFGVNFGYKLWPFFPYSLPWRILSRIFYLRRIRAILAERKIRRLVLTKKINLLISVSIIGLREQTIKFCHKHRVTVVNYLIDDPFFKYRKLSVNDKIFLNSLSSYDLIFSTKQKLSQELTKIISSRKIRFLPVGYSPDVFHPIYDLDHQYPEVVFAGGFDPERIRFLEKFSRAYKGNFRLFGPTFPRKSFLDELRGRAVYGPNYCKVLTNSKIVIGLLRTNSSDRHTSRTFEIPSCYGAGIFMDTAEHREIFRGLPSYAFFSTPKDLAQKCNFLLSNQSRLKLLRDLESEMVKTGKHTYRDRFLSIWKKSLKT